MGYRSQPHRQSLIFIQIILLVQMPSQTIKASLFNFLITSLTAKQGLTAIWGPLMKEGSSLDRNMMKEFNYPICRQDTTADRVACSFRKIRCFGRLVKPEMARLHS